MTEEATIQFFAARDLPGKLRKRLSVPKGYLALLLDGEEVTGQRGPGDHRLWNWPKPAPDVVLIRQEPFDLRPRILHLRSADDRIFDLLWPLTVQVKDVDLFYTTTVSPAPDADRALQNLEDRLAGSVWIKAGEKAKSYSYLDLQVENQVRAQMAREIRGMLTSALGEAGLTLVGSQRPEARTLEDERDALKAASLAAQAAREARFEALFEKLEDKEMLAYRLQEWLAQQGQKPPDDDLVDLIWAAVDGTPEETAIRANKAVNALKDRVRKLESDLAAAQTNNQSWFRQQEASLQPAGSAKEREPAAEKVDGLQWILVVLRVIAVVAAISVAVIAIGFPGDEALYYQSRGVYAAIGAIVALVALLLEMRTRKHFDIKRQRAADKKETLGQINEERIRGLDGLVMNRVEASLKQVTDNLDDAWQKGYDSWGSVKLVTQMRLVADDARKNLMKQVKVANYRTAKTFEEKPVPDKQLGEILNLNNVLLSSSQNLAETARSLFRQVYAGEDSAARDSLAELEFGLKELRDRFTERGAYLGGTP